jgi:hypothetical protein
MPSCLFILLVAELTFAHGWLFEVIDPADRRSHIWAKDERDDALDLECSTAGFRLRFQTGREHWFHDAVELTYGTSGGPPRRSTWRHAGGGLVETADQAVIGRFVADMGATDRIDVQIAKLRTHFTAARFDDAIGQLTEACGAPPPAAPDAHAGGRQPK